MKTQATLIITVPGKSPDKVEIHNKSTTLGSGSASTVYLEGVPGIARRHALIEEESDGYSITAYSNSRNTRINGLILVAGRSQRLLNGDTIAIGNANIKFICSKEKRPLVDLRNPRRRAVSPPNSLPHNKLYFVIAGIGMFIILAAIGILLSAGKKCNNEVSVKAINDGAMVRVEIGAPDSNCIKSIKYILAGNIQIGERTSFPYDIVIDSNDPRIATLKGSKQKLTTIVESSDGKETKQDILVELPVKEPTQANKSPEPSPAANVDSELVARTNVLTAFLFGEYNYNLDDQTFQALLIESIKTCKPTYNNFWKRGNDHKDNIRTAFSAYNIKPAIGHIIAFSRSEFDIKGSADGIWQIPVKVARENGFIQTPEELSDIRTEAKVAADYMKSLRDNFDNNMLLTVAYFGETTGVAGKLNAIAMQSLNSVERKNISKLRKVGLLKDPQLRRLAQFFAVALVASYPKEMGLDAPSLSEIYD